ncbi:MAG: TRC40/GET3/ArsA family transport-energizing ATPase, partial [Myxococcales bacterium]|nr:TRC40/GET3/ArsA family transport-energizing ATPase [Myxococcales bacterium]
GGVGKTTVAAALAVAAAARGATVSLVSTDPAPSLATCVMRPIRGAPLTVAERLDARALDAEAAWARWREDYREELQASLERSSSGIDLTFDREVVERLLELTPPGIDEIVAITELVELAEADTREVSEAPRVLVIDTAATGHFLRLIGMPEVLESWLHAIFRVLLKYRELLRLPRLSDRLIALSRGLKRLRALLGDPSRSEVWVVTIPTEMAKAEADDLLAALAHLDLNAARIWINQVTPKSEGCSLCAALNAREGAVVDRWRAHHRPGTIGRGEPPLGLDALAQLGDGLLGGDGVHE